MTSTKNCGNVRHDQSYILNKFGLSEANTGVHKYITITYFKIKNWQKIEGDKYKDMLHLL